jgi:regulatory protein
MVGFVKGVAMKEEKQLTPDEALAKMEHFCAYRERAPQEVWRKLAELGMTGENAQQIYTVLEGDNYFNEQRFAAAFAGGKFRQNYWGRVRIRMELRHKGISAHLIEPALQALDEQEYYNVLEKLARQKQTQWQGDPQARFKTAKYLIQTGFEQDLVFEVCGQIFGAGER